MTPLRQLQPGPIPQCRFMVLEKRQSQEKENEDLWVADETASILLLDVPTYLGVEEGDLLKLQKGEVLQDDSRLFLRIGHGQLQRDGFLTLLFKETPNLSINWEALAAQAPVPAGHRCFLCGAEDHAVLECKYLPQGVVIRSNKLENLDRAQRRSLVEKALEAKGLAAPEAVRWYKKETSGGGLLYVRLNHPQAAQELIAMEALEIDGEKAKVYGISKGQPAAKVAKGKGDAKGKSREREVKSDQGPCFLCDGTAGAHQAFQCPFWRQCVQVKGAAEEDRDEIWAMLQQRNAEPLTLNFSKASQLFMARVGSVRQARTLCSLGHRGDFRLHNTILRVYPFHGDKSIAGAEPAAPAPSQPKTLRKRRRADVEEAAEGLSTAGSAPSRPKQARKACFLCGDPDHELPTCPSRHECVLVCREWGGGSKSVHEEKAEEAHEALQVALTAQNMQAVRFYWHRGVCYLRLNSVEEAKRAIRLWGQGLELAGEEFRVRVAKSTRSQKGPGKGAGKGEAEELAASTHDKGEEPDVVCLLCGDASHVLKSCKFRSRGLRISCSALEGKTLEEAKEEVSQTFKVLDAALVPDKARWHGRWLCLTMRNDSHVTALLNQAAGEGLEISGAAVSVEKLQPGKLAAAGRNMRTPGLRPEARHAPK